MDIPHAPGITIDWKTVTGGGFMVGVLFLALVERLRRTFATRQDLNGLGERFTALQNLYVQTREAVDETRDHTLQLRAQGKSQAERIDGVMDALLRLTEKVDAVAAGQAAHRAALEHIGRRLDRVEECLDPNPRR